MKAKIFASRMTDYTQDPQVINKYINKIREGNYLPCQV